MHAKVVFCKAFIFFTCIFYLNLILHNKKRHQLEHTYTHTVTYPV